MKAKTIKAMLMSGQHDHLTVGEFANLIRYADRSVEELLESEDCLAKATVKLHEAIGSNPFMENKNENIRN